MPGCPNGVVIIFFSVRSKEQKLRLDAPARIGVDLTVSRKVSTEIVNLIACIFFEVYYDFNYNLLLSKRHYRECSKELEFMLLKHYCVA